MDNKVRVLKEFTHNDKEYAVIAPSLGVVRESKYTYSRYFTEYLKEGFLTRKKMQSLMMESSQSIYEDYVNRRADLLKSMTDVEVLMDKTDNAEDLENLANILNSYRQMVLQEDTTMTDIFNNTADQMAEDERINFLVLSIIRNKDLSKIWEKEEDFLNQDDMEFLEACKYQVMCVEYGLNSDWNKDLPEVKALEKANRIRKEQSEIKEQEIKDQLDKIIDEHIEEEKVSKKVSKVKKTKAQTKKVSKKKVKEG